MSYIGNSPGVASQRVVTIRTATTGQTEFFPDSGYTLGYIDVIIDGVDMNPGVDYTAADGIKIVLTEAADGGEVVKLVAYIPRGLSDGYLKSEADALLSLKADLVGGKIPSAQLPAYVDDVLEFDNLASFPVVGEVGKIYVDKATNNTYRWSGSTYIVLTDLSAYYTSAQVDTALSTKLAKSSNLSDLTDVATARSNLGLGNVENKSSTTIRSEITSLNVTNALGYTPVNKAGDTMSGSLTNSVDIRAPIFYDSDDATYYLNPKGNSYLGAIIIAGSYGGSASEYWIGRGGIGGGSLALYAPAGKALEFGLANSAKMWLDSNGLNVQNRGITTGSVPPGSVIQVQHYVVAGGWVGNTSTPTQINLFNQTFTPLYSSSKVLVIISTGVNFICDGHAALTRNGAIVKDTWFGSSRQDDQYDYPQATQLYLDSPNTTNTITYGIAAWATGCSQIVRIGGSDNHSSWTFMEIAV